MDLVLGIAFIVYLIGLVIVFVLNFTFPNLVQWAYDKSSILEEDDPGSWFHLAMGWPVIFGVEICEKIGEYLLEVKKRRS